MVKASIDEEVAKKVDLERVETSIRSDMKVQHKDLLLYLGGLMVTLSGIVTGVLIGVLKP